MFHGRVDPSGPQDTAPEESPAYAAQRSGFMGARVHTIQGNIRTMIDALGSSLKVKGQESHNYDSYVGYHLSQLPEFRV